jgi:hypothetical protein
MASRMAAAALTAAAAASLASAASLRVWRDDGETVPVYYELDNATAAAGAAEGRRLQTTSAGTVLTTSAAYTSQQSTGTGGTTTFSFNVVDSTLPVTLTFDDYRTGNVITGYSGNRCVAVGAAHVAARLRDPPTPLHRKSDPPRETQRSIARLASPPPLQVPAAPGRVHRHQRLLGAVLGQLPVLQRHALRLPHVQHEVG